MENPFNSPDYQGEVEIPSQEPVVLTEPEVKATEETVVETATEEVKEVVKQEIVIPASMSQRAEILKEFGGLESNVPTNHAYWKL